MTRPVLEAALSQFRGYVMQQPPPFAAVHIDGQRAYKLALDAEADRARLAVLRQQMKPRPVTVFKLNLLEFSPPTFRLRIDCSSGFYVRALVHDLGLNVRYFKFAHIIF